MRPIRLVIEAFGPYGREQVIDFRELGSRSLFLIHGPTGAGKTSILDALSFALYGQGSGTDKEPRDLRSHQAPANLATRVTFDFALGKETYRVTRSPQQNRARKRGEGHRVLPAEATLWRRTGLAIDEEEGRVEEGHPNRVTRRIEELLGFRDDQFRQVVLLPQGQFQRLLLSNSTEREEILEVLFRTEAHSRLEAALEKAAREIQRGLEEEAQERRILLAEAGVETSEGLQELRTRGAADFAMAGRALEETRKAELLAETALREARDLREALRKREETRATLQALEREEAASREAARRLERSRGAAALDGAAKALAEGRSEAKRAEEAALASREVLSRARSALERAEDLLLGERAREDECTSLRGELSRVEALAAQTTRLAEARSALAKADLAHREAAARRSEAEAKLEGNRARHEAARVALQGAAERAAGLSSVEVRLREAREAEATRNATAEVRRRAIEGRERERRAEEVLRGLEATLAEAQERTATAERAWEEGQAALLAARLVPGQPCSVCGSREHPAPAAPSAHPARAEGLRQARTALERARAARDEAREVLSGARASVAALEAEERTLSARHASEEAKEGTPERRQTLEGEASAAREARDRLPALEVDVRRGAEALEEAASVLRRTEGEARRLEMESGRLAAVVSEREASLAEEMRIPGAVERAEARLRETLARAEEALRKAETEATARRNETARREAALEAALSERDRAAERCSALEAEFALHLREDGFADEAERLALRLDPAEADRIERGIRSHHAKLEAARAQFAASEALEGKEAPPVEALESAAAEARRAREEALRKEETLRGQRDRIERLALRIESLGERSRSLEARLRTEGRLAEVASGRNPLRMTFQRWVLAALLEDVLRAATARLAKMSRGRYALLRAETPADQRAAGGLDIEVFDAYSGTRRPAATLSGGEVFLASLSLALGLADVVQSHAGGVHLETIFIDEGFGSLDSEALDLALTTLDDLHAGGRLVGIISHVSELRERVDARLEVTPTRTGSRARFVVSS